MQKSHADSGFMSWQAIDFQRIITLDQSLVEQLDFYLQDKEADLGNEIISSLPTSKEGIAPPVLEPSKWVRLKLSDAVEGFSRRMRAVLQREDPLISSSVLQEMTGKLNEAFLNYIEVIEGCVKEFFLQIDQIGLENWNGDLLIAMDSFNDLFFQHIEELLRAVDRIEALLKEFRKALPSKDKRWNSFKALFGFDHILDPSLGSDLKKLEKTLKSNHKKFSRYLIEYLDLEDKVNISLKKLERYDVLDRLEEVQEKKFKELYFYSKLGQLNAKPKPHFFHDLMRALSQAVNVDDALEIFKEYTKLLYSAHYHQSRVLKKEKVRYLTEPGGLEKINEVMRGYHREILSLGSTIARYRELFLKTDPNPYARSKWGFTEGIVAPEPKQAKELLELEFELENLKKLNDHVINAIAKANKNPAPLEKIPFNPMIHKMLHEMGQPLTTYGMVKTRAEKILEHISDIDEIGSTNFFVIDYTEDILSKMLRADWKFHVLHEIPKYQEIFMNHLGISGLLDDRAHLNRMNKFRYVTKEIALWVEKRETRKHEREIEFDINDLKAYLQDFLASVQRSVPDDIEVLKHKVKDMSHMLLLYRHLFGEFFHHLESSSTEGKHLRQKLIFVDQYFESVDQKLFEIKNSLE